MQQPPTRAIRGAGREAPVPAQALTEEPLREPQAQAWESPPEPVRPQGEPQERAKWWAPEEEAQACTAAAQAEAASADR